MKLYVPVPETGDPPEFLRVAVRVIGESAFADVTVEPPEFFTVRVVVVEVNAEALFVTFIV